MSNNLSNFWATSWDIVESTRGSGAKCGFSSTLMAATARLWPFDFSWLRIDAILKFVEPVTNTDEVESLSVVLLQQGLHRILSPSYSKQGKPFVQLQTKFLFQLLPLGCEASPSSLPAFSFWARGIYRMRIWATGHKKPPISIWRSSLSLKCVMGRLGSSLFSWMCLGREAVHFNSRKRLPVLRFFSVFFLHVKHCATISTALNVFCSWQRNLLP